MRCDRIWFLHELASACAQRRNQINPERFWRDCCVGGGSTWKDRACVSPKSILKEIGLAASSRKSSDGAGARRGAKGRPNEARRAASRFAWILVGLALAALAFSWASGFKLIGWRSTVAGATAQTSPSELPHSVTGQLQAASA